MDLNALANSSLAGSSILNPKRNTTSSANLQGTDFQSLLNSMLSSSGLSGASDSSSLLGSGVSDASSLFGAGSSDSSSAMFMLPLMFSMMEQLLTKQMELLQSGKLTPKATATDPNATAPTFDSATASTASQAQAATAAQSTYKELRQPAVLQSNQTRAQASTASQTSPSTQPNPAPAAANPVPVSAPTPASGSGHASPYGEPAHGPLTQGYNSRHNGLDIGIVVGTPVHSTQDGTVTYAGWSPIGYGNLVIVQNGDYQTYYAHLSKIPVTTGQTVQAGSTIGLSGSTGNSTGPHLHYEIRYKGKNLDPTSLTLNKAI